MAKEWPGLCTFSVMCCMPVITNLLHFIFEIAFYFRDCRVHRGVDRFLKAALSSIQTRFNVSYSTNFNCFKCSILLLQ